MDTTTLMKLAIYLTLAIVILFAGHSFFIKNKPLERVYPLCALLLGIVFLFTIPLYSTPDEKSHFNTSYLKADTILNQDAFNTDSSGWMDTDDINYLKTLSPQINYDAFLAGFKSQGNHTLVYQNLETGSMKSSGYFFSSLGIALAKKMHLAPIWCYLLGAGFNMLVFVILSSYAIGKTPVGKETLFILSLLPMTLQQISSFSYDANLFAAIWVLFAITLKWFYKPPVIWDEIVMYVISACIIHNIKGGIYNLLCILPLIMFIFDRIKTKVGYAILICACILALCGGFYVLYISDYAQVGYQTIIGSTDGNMVYAGSVHDYLANPKYTSQLISNTLKAQAYILFLQMFGFFLGWLNIKVPKLIIAGLIICFLLSLIRKKGELRLSAKHRFCFFIGAAATSMAVICALMIFWTPWNATIIDGLQGRYFLPLLPYFAFAVLYGRIKPIDRFFNTFNSMEEFFIQKKLPAFMAIILTSLAVVSVVKF